MFSSYLPLIEANNVIYRPTDIYKYMGGERYLRYEYECIDLSSAIIATSSKVLDELTFDISRRTKIINNGADFEFFSSYSSNLNRTGCVYVGAVDFRFDVNELCELAISCPGVVFDIYGPVSIDLDCYKIPNNVNFLNAVDYSELPKILSNYCVGLIPMNAHPANDGRSPMKLYEYLAAGLPVILKETVSFKGLRSDVVLTYNKTSEAEGLIKSCHDSYNLNTLKCCHNIAKNVSWYQKSLELIRFSEAL